jgi:hypothetical protein
MLKRYLTAMKSASILLLGFALLSVVSFGPHPSRSSLEYPKSLFVVGPIIRYIDVCFFSNTPRERHLGGFCRSVFDSSVRLKAEVGKITYKVPPSAWLPFYQSGEIQASAPVVFTSEGKPFDSIRFLGTKGAGDSVSVSVSIRRFGLIPLGSLDRCVQDVVITSINEAINNRVMDGNWEVYERAASERKAP